MDLSFGSLGSFLDFNLAGKNCLFVWHQPPEREIKALDNRLGKIRASLLSTIPTRFLLIGPSASLSRLSQPKTRMVLEIARFQRGFPGSTFTGCPILLPYSISIVLALNKESLWRDPIEWSSVKEKLSEWATRNCLNMEVTNDTDLKFRERSVPSHPPRAASSEPRDSSSVYQLFTVTPPRGESANAMLSLGIPQSLTGLIVKINKHNPLLNVIGILPNQLRTVLKGITPDFQEAFQDIGSTLFWHGYQIWKTRQKLMRAYWKNIAREEWKVHSKQSKKSKSKLLPSCESPFHFLDLFRNLTQQRPTQCSCSHPPSSLPQSCM
jgi:hypothetical protein